MRRPLLLGLALGLVLAGCSLPGRDRAAALPRGTGTVVRPVDGDTAVIRIGGEDEHVRFIGIDTPESVSEDVPVECYGPESKARTAELLPIGTVVRLERDVEARDRYGRLLAYVYRDTDDTFVNLVLAQEGFAESTRTRRIPRTRASSTPPRPTPRPTTSVCGPPAAAPTPPPDRICGPIRAPSAQARPQISGLVASSG